MKLGSGVLLQEDDLLHEQHDTSLRVHRTANPVITPDEMLKGVNLYGFPLNSMYMASALLMKESDEHKIASCRHGMPSLAVEVHQDDVPCS